MAAKKQMKSGSMTGKTAQNEVSVEVATKKPIKKTRRRAKSPPFVTLPLHEEIDAQVLTDLAIKIIGLRGGNGPAAGRQSGRLDNSEMHEAIEDARRFLLAAKGVIADDVDAYRLFSADDGLMSYDEIASRFKSCKWTGMTSRNTVEGIILKLVEKAEQAVKKEMDRYETLVSVRYNYLGGVYSLAKWMREQIRAAIGDCELEVLFSSPDRFADAMGQVFLRLMEKDITGDWERPLEEEPADTLGFDNFVEYVCGGMTYEQFIPDGQNVRMGLDRLACLSFFLESADAWQTSAYKAKAKELGILMRFSRGQHQVPDSVVGYIEKFLKELRKTPVKTESVKKTGQIANSELQKFCERMHLAQVVKVQTWRSMALQIQSLLSITGVCEEPQSRGLEVVLHLIRQIEESVQNPDHGPTEIRAKLVELKEKLAETSSLIKPVERLKVIADAMDKAAGNLERGLRAERSKPMDLEQALVNLILELKPSMGAKKCRPYELFLFAAQNRLCREELVRKRTALVKGVVTAPPHRGSLSILISHRGAEIAIGMTDPG